MSLFDGVFGRKRVKLSLTDAAGWNLGNESNAGKTVTPESVMTLSSAWACVRLKSRVVGSLGLPVFARGVDGEREVARKHWLYNLVHESPNADQTPFEFWSGMVACIDLWGNAYAHIERSVGRVTALTPLRPDQMTVKRNDLGERVYRYADKGGVQTYRESEVFHLRGFTLGGDVGLSAVQYGRHSMGLAMAADETAGKTFANGLQVSGFVKMLTGARLDKKQKLELIDLFSKFTGSSRAGKVMPLDPGMEFQPLTMNPQDAQLLETRAFNIEEGCRWYDTPPVLIGHSSQGQTMWGTGLEQVFLGWLATGLDPLLVGIQQAVSKQLLSPAERPKIFAEFNRQALLRADAAGRAEFYSKIFQLAGITPNLIADKEGLPRFAGGDQRFVNSTYVPIDQAGKVRTQPAAGQPI